MTNEELAARLGRDAGTMLHHVRLLVATGFLAPDEERRGARGAVERPYRSTGKSWTLDVGRTRRVRDARDGRRVPGGGRGDRRRSTRCTGARLGVRLTAEQRDAFQATGSTQLAHDLKDADDPAGEPYGFFAGMHRRAE